MCSTFLCNTNHGLHTACGQGDRRKFFLLEMTWKVAYSHLQGTIATWGTFAILYFVALILNIICMFKADGHRVPYGVLIPVQILFALACLADTTLTIFDNIDKLPPWSVYAAIQAVSALFTNWGLALFFVALVLIVQERQEKYRALTKRDSIVLGQRVMFTVAGSHLLFMIVLGLGTTTGVMATNAYNSLKTGGERFQSRYDTYRNTLFASQAFYYITAGAVIYLARSLFKLMKSTHVSDTVSTPSYKIALASLTLISSLGHKSTPLHSFAALPPSRPCHDVILDCLQPTKSITKLQ